MPVENVTSFWDSQLFAAIVSIIGTGIVSGFLHFLSVRRERKKERSTDNATLRQEIEILKNRVAYYEDVEQSRTGNYFLLKATKQPICPVCWGKDHKAIPVYGNETGYYRCGSCACSGVFNPQTVEHLALEQEQSNRELQEAMNHMYDVDPSIYL